MNGDRHYAGFITAINMKLEVDSTVHHPLGAASYVFREDIVKYLAKQLGDENLKISIGAQPNSSPHFGTLTVFSLAFSLARRLQQVLTSDVSVMFEVVDTAPASSHEIDGVVYQQSLKKSDIISETMPQYYEVLDQLSNIADIPYGTRSQSTFNQSTFIPEIVSKIIANRSTIAPVLDPKNELLRVRSACDNCGLSDKKGITNQYFSNHIQFECPDHGSYQVDFSREPDKLEYSTPLRNLIRAMNYAAENKSPDHSHHWMRVTGSDYAGFYQEQMLYRAAGLLGEDISDFPTILYAPLILDWSGAKLSKSLYVKQGAYSDLPNYLVNYSFLRDSLGPDGLNKLYREVDSWVQEPYKLFRHYSVYYFMNKVFQ